MHWSKKTKGFLFSILKGCIIYLLILISFPTYSQTNSVLKEGIWIKIPIQESGVYKLDYRSLQSMGWDLKSLNPKTIRIFGGNGSILPQANHISVSNDLNEIAIEVQGESDGKFDIGDEIYFYGEGTNVISTNSDGVLLQHANNLYSSVNYYFLNIGLAEGKRIVRNNIPAQKLDHVVVSFDDYWFHEKDLTNLLRSGRSWWGEYLATTQGLNLKALISDILPNSEMIFGTSAIAASQVPTSITWQVNSEKFGETSFGTVNTGIYNIKALEADKFFYKQSGLAPSSEWNLQIQYNRNGQSNAQSYLNYVSIQTKRFLKEYGGQKLYYFLPSNQIDVSYQIVTNNKDWKFWNVSDVANTIDYELHSGIVNDTLGLSFRKFVGFRKSDAFVPDHWVKISNQNIKGEKTPELIIITAPEFIEQAQRLATHKYQTEALETLVATSDQIYNEFSYGKVDISAIRNYIKYLYLQNPAKLKYVLLFGDATYDYKNLLKNQPALQQKTTIPVYESRESLNPVQTYSSDDFYGFLEAHEGNWEETFEGNHTLELGVGRLPVKNINEASTVVDKIIQYASSKNGMGKWRNRVHFVADDGDGEIHQEQVDELAKLAESEMLSTRIFLDAFQPVESEYGQVVPNVNQAILKTIQNGTLILNYTGHGGTSGWAQEQVLTLADMQAARGYQNMPLLITATCDFGRYDDHAVVSGGELMVLSPKGAAIAALSTTRPVYSSTNFLINKAFYQSFMKLGRNARLGDLLRLTKNASLAGNLNRNFSLLGDPSLRLARAGQTIGWELIPDTLSAWEEAHFKGHILDENQNVDATFTGTANVQVFDRPEEIVTFGNKGEAKRYAEYKKKLFEGKVSVINGKFEVNFKMPETDQQKAIGKIYVYAIEKDSLSDASGQHEVWVGGRGQKIKDEVGPIVKGYMNHPTFKNGDRIVGPATLILEIKDSSGIYISNNMTNSGIVLFVNDTLEVNISSYYIANQDSYVNGSVQFPIDNFKSGKYKFLIKVRDAYNNLTDISFEFQLDQNKGVRFQKVNLFPNPVENELFLEIVHSRPKEDIELVMTFYNKLGQKKGVFKKQYYNTELLIKENIPPLYLKSLNFIENPYLYRLEIRSLLDQSIDIYTGKFMKLP